MATHLPSLRGMVPSSQITALNSGTVAIPSGDYNVSGNTYWIFNVNNLAGQGTGVPCISVTPAGSLYFGGRTLQEGGSNAQSSFQVTKLRTSDGLIENQFLYYPKATYTSTQQGYNWGTDANGNFYLIGGVTYSGVPNQVLVAKFTPNGVPLWEKRFGQPSSGGANVIGGKVSAAGDVYVAYRQSGLSGSTSAVITKFNTADGTIAWSKRYYNSDEEFNGDIAINETDQVVLVTGYSSATGNQAGTYLEINMSNGSINWQRYLQNAGTSVQSFGVAVASNGESYYNTPNTAPNWQSVFVKYNENGTLQWKQRATVTANNNNTIFGQDVAVDSSSNAYFVGYFANPSQSNLVSAYVIKTNSSGTVQWRRELRVQGTNSGYDAKIDIDSNNDIYVSMRVANNQTGISVFKLNPDGSNTGSWVVNGLSHVIADAASLITVAGDSLLSGGTSSLTAADTNLTLTDNAGGLVTSFFSDLASAKASL